MGNAQRKLRMWADEKASSTLDEMVEQALKEARAEGFRAARERAIVEVNLEREARDEEEIPAGVVIARIRAMEDAGEGGEPCSRCQHKKHGEFACHESVPVPGEFDRACMCTDPETSREPPLSQLRAATERMEAATRAEVDGDLKPIRGFAMPPPGVLAAIRARHANPGDASETSPTPAAMLGEAVELLARVVQLAQMGGAPGVLVSSCQRALHNMRVEKREAKAREGQG